MGKGEGIVQAVPVRGALVLIVDQVRSAHNVGAFFRTADGAGVSHVYLVGYTPTPHEEGKHYLSTSEKALAKTALGAEKTIPWSHVENLQSLIEELKSRRFSVVALEQSQGSIDYREWQPKPGESVALIVGNEVLGVQKPALHCTDVTIHLPMRGKKESLNVSVAAGIALYHLSATMEKLSKNTTV